MTSRGGPQYHPLQDRGEDPLVESPDSSETGLLLGAAGPQQLPRPHTTTTAAATAGGGQQQAPGAVVVAAVAAAAADRSISPASVAAARGDGGRAGSSRSRPQSSTGGAAAAAAGDGGGKGVDAEAGGTGGEVGEGASLLALRVKTLDSKEHRVAVAATATVAEVRERRGSRAIY